MFIDNVTCDLIEIFVNSKKKLTIKYLAEKIGKSRRIVYYVIEKLNIELKKNNIDIIVNESRKGVLLTLEQKLFLKDLIKDVDYILNSEERKLAISLFISTFPKKHTVESLVNTFMVTKNTIIFDINDIRKNVKKFNENLNIQTGNKGGYILVGEELVEIQYVYSVLKQIFNSKKVKFIQFILNLYKDVSIIFTNEFITELVEKVIELEDKSGKKIAPKELDNFIFSFPYLYLFAIQTVNTKFSEKFEKLKARIEYKLVEELFISLKLKYNDKILNLFTLILLCTSKILDTHSASKDYTELIDIANRLVYEFENDKSIQIEFKNQIINEIVIYLKVVAVRNEYNIISDNVDVEKVREKYDDIYCKVEKIVKLENVKFNSENIALLTMIFAKLKKNPTFNILLVTDEGTIIKNFIKSKLIANIHNVNVDIIRKSKLKDIDLSNINLVVSTEQIGIKKDFIQINKIITNEDLLNVFKFKIDKSY